MADDKHCLTLASGLHMNIYEWGHLYSCTHECACVQVQHTSMNTCTPAHKIARKSGKQTKLHCTR